MVLLLAPGKVFVPPASQARSFGPSSPGSPLGLTLCRLLCRLLAAEPQEFQIDQLRRVVWGGSKLFGPQSARPPLGRDHGQDRIVVAILMRLLKRLFGSISRSEKFVAILA